MSYSYVIQKDLPLISFKLDATGISSGNSVTQDGYLSKFPGTSTATNGIFRATCTEKQVSILHGSPRSVYITQNNATSTLGAIEVPAMGFATNKFKSNPLSLEFFIKPKTHLSFDSVTKIVGKPNSQTGVYVHNSSFIGIIGDTAGNVAKVVIPVDNMSKPFHVVFVYQENSVTLIVNGIGKTTQFDGNLLSTSAYAIANDVFRFFDPGVDYAIDNISIYAYPMTILTARRHMVYGLGYQIPESIAEEFGGYRYNLSLSKTKLAGVIQKHNSSTWLNRAEINNLVIEKNNLRINKFEEPARKYATDKSDSIFSFTSDGLKITSDGGYVEVYPQRYGSYVKTSSTDSNPNGSGFACIFKKTTSDNLSSGEVQTLMLLQDPLKDEYSLKIYLRGESSAEAIYYQINNNSPVKLGSNISGGIDDLFAVGYFYNSETNNIYIFQQVNGETQAISDAIENESLFPISYSTRLRLMSEDIFDEYDASTGLTGFERFEGGLVKLVQLDTNVTDNVYSTINSRIDKYTATADSTEDRFIVNSTGWIKFKIDAKRLDGINGLIGANRVEWGHDSEEISVTASPIGSATGAGTFTTYSALDLAYSSYSALDAAHATFNSIYSTSESDWFTEETLINRGPIKGIMGKESGNTRGILITITFNSNDVVENPTTCSYFRLYALATELESEGVYKSVITMPGPDLELTYTDAKNNLYLPDYRETPFLWTEERGGLRVSRTAKINYDISPSSGDDTTSGLSGISFMINVPDSTNRTICTITDGTSTATLTTSGNTLIKSGCEAYINGSFGSDGVSTDNSIDYGVWNHITVVFTSRMNVSDTTNVDIVFGSTSQTSDFYLDEITTLDGDLSSTTDKIPLKIFNLYNGNNVETPTTTSTSVGNLIFKDLEISNSTEIYQPMIRTGGEQTSLLEDVDLASYSNRSVNTIPGGNYSGNLSIAYGGPSSLLVDGTYMQSGDRILLKNQSTSSQNGIFTVSFTYDTTDTDLITTINLTRVSVAVGSLVYVKDGVTNKGTHWVCTTANTGWEKAPYLKKVDAYTFEGTPAKTDLVAKATITI